VITLNVGGCYHSRCIYSSDGAATEGRPYNCTVKTEAKLRCKYAEFQVLIRYFAGGLAASLGIVENADKEQFKDGVRRD